MLVKRDQTTDAASQNATREALRRITTTGGVLTTHETTPHVSQRMLVQYIGPHFDLTPHSDFEYVLMNLSQQSTRNDDARMIVDSTMKELAAHPDFKLEYQSANVYLYKRAAAQQ